MVEDREQGGEMQGSEDKHAEAKLELPSLRRFGRRKSKARSPEQTTQIVEAAEPVAEPTAADPVEPPATETRPLPAVDAERRTEDSAPAPSGPAPSEDRARRLPPAPPPADPVTGAESEPEVVEAPDPVEEPLPVEPMSEGPVDQTISARDDGGRSLLESLRRDPGEPLEPEPRRRRARKPRRERKPRRQRRAEDHVGKQPRKLPNVNPYVVAILTGAIVGAVGVALTIGTGRGCEAVRGVGSCGGFGLFAMIVILAIQVILGAALLRAFRLPDSSSTSFLGVGLAAVVVLLFFLSALDSLWMFLVIPVLTAATMTFSWWLTSNFVERPPDDLTGSNLD